MMEAPAMRREMAALAAESVAMTCMRRIGMALEH